MGEPTEAELRAFFGPRADYYLAQWRGTASQPYNLAALFFSGFWLPFRRLYRHAVVLWSVVLGMAMVSLVASPSLRRSALGMSAELAAKLAIPSTCAIFGNGWYLARARERIARVRAKSLPTEQHLLELSRAGGTRGWHAVAFIIGVVVVAFAVAAVLALAGLA